MSMKRCATCAHYRGWYERCAHPWKAVATHPDRGEMCEHWEERTETPC